MVGWSHPGDPAGTWDVHAPIHSLDRCLWGPHTEGCSCGAESLSLHSGPGSAAAGPAAGSLNLRLVMCKVETRIVPAFQGHYWVEGDKPL